MKYPKPTTEQQAAIMAVYVSCPDVNWTKLADALKLDYRGVLKVTLPIVHAMKRSAA